MSLLRQAAGLELRSVVTPPPYPEEWTVGDIPGTTGWGPGMVWRGNPWGDPTSSALRLSAVFACIRLISEAIATLPVDTFRRVGGVRRPVRPRPQFLDFPNRSRIDYLSQLVISLLTDGNAYVALIRDGLGEILDTIVLDPARVQVAHEGNRGVVYRVNGQPVEIMVDLLHIKGMSLPGALTGMSPIAYARETVDLGLSAQRFGSTVFTNNSTPPAVIEAPQKFSTDAAALFRDTWEANHAGIGNAHRIGVLTEGAHLNSVSISAEDSQFLQTRAFQVPDVARFYGVPPHLIADASNSTSWGSGLAEQNSAFGQFTLRGWCERVEEGHTRLMPGLGLPDVFVKLNLDALLRATPKERWDQYALMIDNKAATVNEVRSLEDMPPVPWGDEPLESSRLEAKIPVEVPATGTPVPPPPKTGA